MLPGKTALALLLSGAALSTSVFAAPSVYPTGVTRYDPNKAFNQYVIFSGADKQTHLIDMNGNEVKTWPQAGFPSAIIDPQLVGGERGHVLLQLVTRIRASLVPPATAWATRALANWTGTAKLSGSGATRRPAAQRSNTMISGA